jgi:hypothetical protein
MFITCCKCEGPIESDTVVCPYCACRQPNQMIDSPWFWPVVFGLMVMGATFLMVDYAADLGVARRLLNQVIPAAPK